jgi:hypothetical protein
VRWTKSRNPVILKMSVCPLATSSRRHGTIRPKSVFLVCSLQSGRTVAQAVSRRLLGFEPGSSRVGFVMDRAALAGSLRVLRFPTPLIHSNDCSTIIIIYHPWLVQ